MSDPNPFQRVGLETVPFARRRKVEKEKARLEAKTPRARAELAKGKQWGRYLEELEKRRKILTSGPYAGTAEALVAFLKALTLDDGEQLIEMAAIWQGAPSTTRYLVLQMIDEAMINLRERNGLAPFDDPLWDEPDNAFITIRRMLA